MNWIPSGTHVYYTQWAEPGDRVKVDEPIAQIETDKVTAESLFFFFFFFGIIDRSCNSEVSRRVIAEIISIDMIDFVFFPTRWQSM